MRNLTLAAGVVLLQITCLAAPPTDQQKRGHDIFVNSKKGAPCSTCHSLAGEGTAVGPDLTMLGGAATPAGMRMAILATQTVYVQNVKLANGASFPAMKGKEEGNSTEYFDLSKTPPAKRTLSKADVDSIGQNSSWKHPPESTGYSDDELDDVIAYIRYIAKGENKTK